jgi:hypothetical protein
MNIAPQDTFHAYLTAMGYQVPRDSQVFLALLDLYMSGEWGEMVQTDFMPVWIWNAKAKAILSPFEKVRLD